MIFSHMFFCYILLQHQIRESFFVIRLWLSSPLYLLLTPTPHNTHFVPLHLYSIVFWKIAFAVLFCIFEYIFVILSQTYFIDWKKIECVFFTYSLLTNILNIMQIKINFVITLQLYKDHSTWVLKPA